MVKAEPETQPEPVTKTEAEREPLTESIEEPQDRTREQAEAALERAMQAEMKRREEAERQAKVERETREHRETMAREQKKREQREKQRTARSSNSGAGGSSKINSSSGRVSASTGSILNYKSLIQSRIARNRPATAYTGNVVIVLSLTTSGRLKSIRVTRSSGNSALDRQALSTVRRAAPFPPAPSGIHPGSLSNVVVQLNFQR
jgi:protein TonB